MNGKDKPQRKFTKKKFSHQSAAVPPFVRLTAPATAVVPPTIPNATRNVAAVRRALNIPRPQHTKYEAQLDKQLASYRQAKSMEMFKERSAKFTCVDQRQQEDATTARGESSSNLACLVDSLDPRELEAIRTYEERERHAGIGTMEKRTHSFSIAGDIPEKFGPIPLRFDPSVPPPPLFRRQQPNETAATTPMSDQSSAHPLFEGTSTSLAFSQAPPPNLDKEIKREVEIEVSDEIPCFNNVIGNPAAPTPAQPTSSDSAEFIENEEQKRKLQLLWSLCQEELTVDSELLKQKNKKQELSQSIEELRKALESAEKTEEKLKQSKRSISERKKRLLTGTSDGRGKKPKLEAN